MRPFLILLGLMALALITRFVGWISYVNDWIRGTANRVPTADAISMGVAGGWAIAGPVLAACGGLVSATAALCAFVLAIPLVVARVTRRSPPTVFVSYHSSRQDPARRLSEALALRSFRVQFVPFDPAVRHDELLAQVDRALMVSEFVVCFPGDAPSFVEAEILAASTARKSIVFAVDYPHGRIPNTASRRYPVLMTAGVGDGQFKPVVDLLRYLHGDWRATLALYFLPNAAVPSLKRINDVASVIVFVCFAALFLTMWFGFLGYFALEYFLPPGLKISVFMVMFFGMFCLLGLMLTLLPIQILVNGVSGIVRRQRAAKAAREAIKSGTHTDALLRAAFAAAGEDRSTLTETIETRSEDVGFLAALWPDRPLAHHEVPQDR
jgi:hypothetical protein